MTAPPAPIVPVATDFHPLSLKVDEIGPVAARLAHELIDGFEAERSCDLMERFCFPLAMRVLVELLRFPIADTELLDGWGNDLTVLFIPNDPDAPDDVMVKPMSDEEWLERWMRLAQAREYFEQLIDDRLEHSQTDRISSMVHAPLDDGYTALNREHVVTHLVEFISAGKEAMTDPIASMVVVFAEQPHVLAELCREPGLWANVVEEALRMRGNALGLLRVATADVEIAGHIVARGSRVLLLVSAVNHDPDHVPDPDRFDLHRENIDDHLAFGRGIHKCIGSPLTCVACRSALEVLCERLPEVQPSVEPVPHYQPSLLAFMRGAVVRRPAMKLALTEPAASWAAACSQRPWTGGTRSAASFGQRHGSPRSAASRSSRPMSRILSRLPRPLPGTMP
jgi:cytochrome P450